MPHFADGGWSPVSGLLYQNSVTVSNTTGTGVSFASFQMPSFVNQIDLTKAPYKYTTWVRFTIYGRVDTADVGGTSPTATISVDYSMPETGATATYSVSSFSVATAGTVSQASFMLPVLPGSTVTFKRTTGGTIGGTPASLVIDVAMEGV